mgnify:CR=1 FL=1
MPSPSFDLGRSPARLAIVFTSAAASALLWAAACLPDLAPLPPEEAPPDDDASVVVRACGDGVVETLDDGGDAGESCDPGDAGTTLGCADCHVACPDGRLDPESHHCYLDAGPATSLAEARQRCDERAAHIVTVASAREAALLGDAGYWIGLLRSELVAGAYLSVTRDEPGFPCPGCFGVGADDAGAFEPLDPDASAQPNCLASVGGRWAAVDCAGDGGFAAVCEREPEGQRGQGCGGAICFTLPATAGEKTYVLFASPASADEAASTCAGYEGGRLALLDSSDEREQLAREVAQFLPAGPGNAATFWIGLRRVQDGTWAWDDGASEGQRAMPWGVGQPAGAGAGRAFLRLRTDVVDAQLAYAEDDAGVSKRAFVCQRPAAP